MKRFVWRLQKVLDVRKKQEEIKRIELFRLTETLAGKQSELLMRRIAMQDMIERIAGDTSPERLRAQEFFLKQAATNDEQIRELCKEIAALESRQREKTAELLTIRRSRDSLERLRAETRERFLREHEKLEQKELDDRATITFVRADSREG
jgi:flagellar FliJ protein